MIVVFIFMTKQLIDTIMSYEDIPGYVGLYKIDKQGNILSIKNNKTLTPIDNGTGYYQVGLYNNGIRKRHYMHVLVWKAHKGKIPANKEVAHIDHIRSHYYLSNLKLLTRKQNMKEMLEMKRLKTNENNGDNKKRKT